MYGLIKLILFSLFFAYLFPKSTNFLRPKKPSKMSFGQQFHNYLNNETEFNEKEVLEAKRRRISFQSFVIFILIGIPIWWIATTPYRAKLPQIEPTILETLKKDLELIQPNSSGNGIWDNLGQSPDYNLHFIFIQNATNAEDGINSAKIILEKINAFSKKYFQPIGMKLGLSSEHIWDFNLADFLLINFGSAANINFADENIASAISTELDKISSPPVGKETLLKISIFFNEIDKNKQNENDGIAIASWGGLFFHQINGNIESVLNSILANLQLQFGIPPIGKENGKMETLEMALKLHQQRICLKNMLQTVQMLNSLHQLASKIEDLVISDEVAQFAEESSKQFFKAYNALKENGKFDSESAAEARRLAEFANGHHSLLELLNFPADQKYGIYVPLFLPILAPIFQPLTLFFLFLIAKFKEWKNKRKPTGEEKNDTKID